MRKHSSSYSVSYNFRNLNVNGTTCYSSLFSEIERNLIKKDEVLTLRNIKCEETIEYLEIFTKKLCLIFDLKYELNIDENFVKIKGFKTCVSLKVFVTLYRMLWEHISYADLETSILDFVKHFSLSKDRRLIKTLCKMYDEFRVNQGNGHGLRSKIFRGDGSDRIVQFQNKKEFQKALTENTRIHSVFIIK